MRGARDWIDVPQQTSEDRSLCLRTLKQTLHFCSAPLLNLMLKEHRPVWLRFAIATDHCRDLGHISTCRKQRLNGTGGPTLDLAARPTAGFPLHGLHFSRTRGRHPEGT